MDLLCLEFVNSSWYITHKFFSDPLRDNEWLIKLADKWNIKSLPLPSIEDQVKLIQMRSHFAEFLAKIANGINLRKSDIELINSYMADVSFCRLLQVENEEIKLIDIPVTRNWSWFMAEIAASFSNFYSSEAVNNLKLCQNPECGWFFIDESKSGKRKWCDDTCASLMKVRRFREKQKRNDI